MKGPTRTTLGARPRDREIVGSPAMKSKGEALLSGDFRVPAESLGERLFDIERFVVENDFKLSTSWGLRRGHMAAA